MHTSCVTCACRYDFTGWSVLEHSHHPINWSAPPEQQQHPLAAKEPRKGRRLTLSADVATPHGCIRVYCCHLEVGVGGCVWPAERQLAAR